MRLKILLLPVIVCLGWAQLFSSCFMRLDEADLAVEPGPQGNPTVKVEGESFFIRGWEPDPGCYRLVRIGWIDYNFASQVDDGFCMPDRQ